MECQVLVLAPVRELALIEGSVTRNDASDARTKRQTVTTQDQRLQIRLLVKLQGLQIKVIDKTEVPPVGKRCGFVHFANRTCAEQASAGFNGT